MDLYDELHANYLEYLRLVTGRAGSEVVDERSKKPHSEVAGRVEIVAHAGSGSVK